MHKDELKENEFKNFLKEMENPSGATHPDCNIKLYQPNNRDEEYAYVIANWHKFSDYWKDTAIYIIESTALRYECIWLNCIKGSVCYIKDETAEKRIKIRNKGYHKVKFSPNINK